MNKFVHAVVTVAAFTVTFVLVSKKLKKDGAAKREALILDSIEPDPGKAY